MKKRILDENKDRGITNKMWMEDGQMIVQTIQDLNPHLKNAKEQQKISDHNTAGGIFCSIPSHFIDKWSNELPVGRNCLEEEFEEFLKNKINSPEFESFRFKKGKI